MSERNATAEAATEVSEATTIRAVDHQVTTGREPELAPAPTTEPEVTIQDLLVEEVSIDGMCGVY